METDERRKVALETIRKNISLYEHQLYVVAGAPDPRFAYTIGLSRSIGFKLILAGAIFYMLDDVSTIINALASRLKADGAWQKRSWIWPRLASFSWNCPYKLGTGTILGALDFYQVEDVPALLVIPDEAHWTIDTPNPSEP